jgi:two-component system, NtrC family, sensor kinase
VKKNANKLFFSILLITLLFCGVVEYYPATATSLTDSINNILKSHKTDDVTLNKLNHLVEARWESTPNSESVLKDAMAVHEAAKKSDNDTILADALINLVRVYLSKYESSKALYHALEAYNLYEKAGIHNKMGYALLQIGVIYYTQNNYSKSLEYYNNAVNEYEMSGNKYYLSTLFYLSGINYSKLRNYSSAHLFFNRALELKAALNDEQGLAECNMGIAELFIVQNMPDSAVLYINKTTAYAQNTNNKYGIAKAQILLSEVWLLKNEILKAKKSVVEGLRLAENAKAKELIIDGQKALYRVNESDGNFKEAFYNLLDYVAMRDSVINEKTTKGIARLEADYIIEKKQNEIKLLENQNKNRTVMMWASAIIGVLAMLLAGLFFNKQQLKQKANLKLKSAYDELETTQKQLINQEKLASLGQLTAGISADMLEELKSANTDTERENIITDIKLNLEKIAKHGERANSIITRMLDHSRSGEREVQLSDINKLIQEYYSLSYQATRINSPGFFCNAAMQLDDTIPPIKIVTQELSRVLLNIFNNSLYALAQKKAAIPEFTPNLNISSKKENNHLTITITDNGTGIPQEILDKIFQPFFTTKPAGEGTGLGLSLSNDIVIAHGGSLTASNNTTGGAQFIITLPINS